jgi:uncharacterized membrane protein
MARSNGTTTSTSGRTRSRAAPARNRHHTSRPRGPARNVLAVAEMERAGRAQQRPGQRLASRVAAASGTIAFLWVQLLLTAAWITFNTWPGLPHIDPFPYVFLTLVLSIEAILLSIFILMSQNEETRQTERRAALDLQIDLLAEQESTRALRMLHKIGDKLGVQFDADPELKNLERATRPDQLAEQIDAIDERGRS